MREFAGAYRLGKTIKSIEIVIGAVLLIAGLYIISPYWQPSLSPGASALRETLTTRLSLSIFAIIYGGSGAALLYGVFWDKVKVRQHALFVIFLAITFTVSLQLATQGLRPVTWLANLGLGTIAGIIWIALRGIDKNGGH